MPLSVPIVPRHEPVIENSDLEPLQRIAGKLLRSFPELRVAPPFQDLTPHTLHEAPSLLLDDVTDVPTLAGMHDANALQYRSSMRAVAGDHIALCAAEIPGFPEYCEHTLGMGALRWLRPRFRDPLAVASACWQDQDVRAELLDAMHRRGLRYLHPHIGVQAVWVLARLLKDAAATPLEVVAPPPGLCQFVNHKGRFAGVVRQLLGPDAVVTSVPVCNAATLAATVRKLAHEHASIAVKIPNAVGGRGNIRIRSADLQGHTLLWIRDFLRQKLRHLPWHAPAELVVGEWAGDVLTDPSVQLWIPPPAEGGPVVEGLYVQRLDGSSYLGSQPAQLPASLTAQIVKQSWLLGRLFQILGYVGRCSFDLLVRGPDLDRARPQFVECNGRWGGCSLPMTLMNRLHPSALPPYVTHLLLDPVLEHVSFPALLGHFSDLLLGTDSGTGQLIFFSPGRMKAGDRIGVIVWGETAAESLDLLRTVEARVARLVVEPQESNASAST